MVNYWKLPQKVVEDNSNNWLKRGMEKIMDKSP